MKFYKGENTYYYIEFLVYNDISYYFYTDDDEGCIETSSGTHEWDEDYKEIQYKDLPDKMKAFLKSIRFKSSMSRLLDNE